MNRRRIHYLPMSYLQMQCTACTIWHSPDEPAEHLSFLADLAHDALAFLAAEIAFVPRRSLHLCCFRANAEACSALERVFPPTMALAPYAGDEAGLVVVQSPAASPMNADLSRMRRILVHEFAHLLVMEATGSRKVLGDGNRHMRVASWLNEGIAEICVFRSEGREDRIDALLRQFADAADPFSFGELSTLLDDLGSPERGRAFAHATAAVASIAQEVGMARLLSWMARHDLQFEPQLACSQETIARCVAAMWAER